MVNLKDTIITKGEKSFTLKWLANNIRIDGRAFQECRELKIDFGRNWGCCYVSLGETKVFAAVSCEIQQPKVVRPSEGILIINVELSPMAAPNFEPGRQSQLSVHLNRVLEKSIKDSRAVDLESLCIKTSEKVWCLRVDVNVLNHDGNILDCASIAALTALTHFKRPDVTCDGENIIIHSPTERDLIPTTLHHYPVCVSYALFNAVNVYVVDPTYIEQCVADTELVFSINAFKEICSAHIGGKGLASAQLIYECASKAASVAFTVVQKIKEVIELDKEERNKEAQINFSSIMDTEINLNMMCEKLDLWNIKDKLKKRKKDEKKTNERETEMEVESKEVLPEAASSSTVSDNTAENEADFENSSDESIIEIKPKIDRIDISDDSGGGSEEDDVVILN